MKKATTTRWTPLRYHAEQSRLWNSDKRFIVVPSGRRSGKCLAKDSRIYMYDGTVKKVQDVKVGDIVWSIDSNFNLEPKKVKHVFENGVKEIVQISTNKNRVKCTINHPFLVNGEWVEAKDIKLKSLVASTDETCESIEWDEVTSIKSLDEEETYDLTVEDNHNFIVNGLVTHNTELAKRKLVIKALEGTDFPRPQFFAGAPTRDQAKRIYWEDLKALVPPQLRRGKPKESELTIDMINGSSISVVGLDVPERVEGSPWDGGILDEYGNMKKKAWEENVRPALSDRKGWCWFIGVPEGRNHYYNQYKYAKSGEDPEWDAFHWFSSDILPPEEIASAKNTLDELVYRQEYEGEFINFQGRIYYNFLTETHAKRLNYYPDKPLILCFDFNIAPGICAIIQEQLQAYTVDGIIKSNIVSAVIGEVYIQRDSNTEKICREIIKDWNIHKGEIKCYGDSTGGSKGTAKVKGSDWDIVRETLKPVFGDRLSFEIPQKNPLERQRVNSVNSRLKSADGTIRLLVDPMMAEHVIDDFEGVESKENSSGEIDKNKNPELTHYTDAIGYYINREFPYSASIITKSGVSGM